MLFESINFIYTNKYIYVCPPLSDAQLSLLTNSKSDDKLDLANLFVFFFFAANTKRIWNSQGTADIDGTASLP